MINHALMETFWTISGIVGIMLTVFLISFFVWFKNRYLKKRHFLLNEYFKNQIIGLDVSMTTKIMKKNRFKTAFMILNSVWASFLCALIIIYLISSFRESKIINFNSLWPPILFLILSGVISNFILLGIYFYIIKKSVKEVLTDEEIISNFLIFKKRWIATNGTTKINFIFSSTSIFFNNANINDFQYLIRKSLRLHLKYPKNYNHWCLQGLINYLEFYSKHLDKLVKYNEGLYTIENFKFILVHNFMCDLVWADNLKVVKGKFGFKKVVE